MDILNPEIIIIGGIYKKTQSLIEPIMKEVIEKEALQGAYKVCKIVPSLFDQAFASMVFYGENALEN